MELIVYNFNAGPYSNDTLDKIKTGLFNAVICIGGIKIMIPKIIVSGQ